MGNYDGVLFLPPLVKLGRSLGSGGGSGSSSTSESTACIATLLRVLDNILAEHASTATADDGAAGGGETPSDDAANKNARLRRIRVRGPFHARVGRHDGGIDFLVACGFVLVAAPSSGRLELRAEDEDPTRLFAGRCRLIVFARDVLRLAGPAPGGGRWPDCPYEMVHQRTTAREKTTATSVPPAMDAGAGATTDYYYGEPPSSGRRRSVREDEVKMLEYSSPAAELLHRHSQQHSVVEQLGVGCCSSSPATTSPASTTTTTTTTTAPSEKVSPPCTRQSQRTVPITSVATNSALEFYNSLQSSRMTDTTRKVDDDTNVEISDDLLCEIENELNGVNNDDESSFLDYDDGTRISLNGGAMIDVTVGDGADVTTPATTNMDVNNPPVAVTVCNYEYDDSNIDESMMVVIPRERETIVLSSSSSSSSSSHANNSSAIRLEKSKRQGSAIYEDEHEETTVDDDHRDKMDDTMTDSEHDTCHRSASIDPAPTVVDGKQSPQLQLSKMVERILDSTTEDVDSNNNPSSINVVVSGSAAMGCKNVAALVDDPLGGSYKSASDMLGGLELDSEFNQRATEFYVQQQQQQQQQHASDYINVLDDSIRIEYDHKQDEREDIPNHQYHHHSHPNHSESSSSLLLVLPTQPPLDNVLDQSDSHDIYTRFFNNIPLPGGEFSSSSSSSNNCDDTEDVRKYRMGFLLCHQLLFSLWSTDMNWESQGIAKKNSSTGPYYVPASSFTIDPTIGLTDLRRHRQIWEDEIKDVTTDKPLMLIPLDIVYVSWAWFLRLNEGCGNDRECEGDTAAVADAAAVSGKMYLWIMSNHHHLSKIDDVSITSTHPTLPETSVDVCNYICKSLRDIGLISIYSAGIAVGGTSKSAEYFLGINDENLFQEDMPRKLEDIIPILLLNDVELLRECHAVLSELVCPKLHNALDLAIDTDNDLSMNSRWTCWYYSCRHAVKHLIASARLEEAKLILSDTRYIRLRMRNMGLLVGTAAHCRDCLAMALILSQSPDRRNKQSDSIAGWSEEHYKILCSVSSILRKKAGDLTHDQNDSRRRTLQMDVGNAMQMIGKCIADIGIYRVQEIEHYEEALALKTESYGGDQNHESLADILVSILSVSHHWCI